MKRLSLVVSCLLVAACGSDGSTGGNDGAGGGRDGSAAVDLSAGVDGGGCGLRTCASAGANCGVIGDGCGALIDCGTCSGVKTCGGGGMPNVCGGTMGCVPRTCAGVGYNCGPAADGCGGLLMCGTCPMGQSCGTGGKPNVCGGGGGGGDGGTTDGGAGCTPTTCAALGYNCGPAGDGCGKLLDCGTCPMGQSCGVGGKPSVCAPNNGCTPRSCAQQGFTCGMAGDGCGGAINCGTCMMPSICGGGGVPNNCGGGGDGGVQGGCVNLCLKQAKCDAGTTSLSGTVVAPTDPARFGAPDPLYNALVYVPNSPVMPFTKGVSCDQCGTEVSGSPLVSVNTGPDGKFTLTNVPCGVDVPIVIQLGRWRRQVTIKNVACCQNTALTLDQTRLPRNHTEGDIPQIAMVTGDVDSLECVLRKIGIDDSEFSVPGQQGGTGRVQFYIANGSDIGNGAPSEQQLWGTQTEIDKFDMVVFACEGAQMNEKLADQQRVIAYADKGGRVFATHFSYVWLFNDAPWSGTATWKVNQGAPPDPLTATVDQSFPKGVAFAQWLKNVGASPNLGQVQVKVGRHDFDAVTPPSQRWLYSTNPAQPLHYTFNTPVGAAPDKQCGRVLFSDFHVLDAAGNGFLSFPQECDTQPMTPQEKTIEFMLFDLSSCVQPDKPTCTPKTCAQLGFNCGLAGDGCGNLINCGVCAQGQVCGAMNPNVCGATMCTPLTCGGQGIQCGPAGDGCGKLLDCGMCPMGQTCGGGGPGKCGAQDMSLGCAPITCAQQNLACGPAGDGCGNVIQCGPCPMGQTCGGGGVAGQCGAPMCTPRTCAQANATCGLIGDGCGGSLNCGTCPMGQTCGGGGVANQCGAIG